MKLRWFIIGLCAISGGCELFQVGERDLTYETYKMDSPDSMMDRGKYRRTAAAAWRSHQAANPDVIASLDLAEGFMDGYAAFLETVHGVPPELPPERYWKPRYRSLEGRRAIADWFEGYRQGTLEAQAGRVSREVMMAPAPVSPPSFVAPSAAPRPQTFHKAAPPLPPEPKPAAEPEPPMTPKLEATAAPEPNRLEKVELPPVPPGSETPPVPPTTAEAAATTPPSQLPPALSSSGPAPADFAEAPPPATSLSKAQPQATPRPALPEQLPALPTSAEPEPDTVMPSEPQPKDLLPASGTLLFPPEDDQRPRRGAN